ncbi:unnamed protein product [Rotaria socialis]|uniref:Uncharacterized protein n=1 Tax=Rotaria socialis TaxID=392032 RepID=A0A817TKY5_9BILA|nr:unnamed protein product [Rotaria socialis]CAF4512768.1 unnamed protein product [Rotaria socialis]
MLFFILIIGVFVHDGIQAFGNTTQSGSDIIYLDKPLNNRNRNGYAYSTPQFFLRTQTPVSFYFTTAMVGFVKVPGLSLALHHSRARLYEIRFQGSLYTTALAKRSYIRIMIDDAILISNKLYPNTEERKRLDPSFENNLLNSDIQGGIYLYSSSSNIVFPCVKFETAYIPAGTHSIDVVIRTEDTIIVHGSELFVKVFDIDESSQSSLPLVQTVSG